MIDVPATKPAATLVLLRPEAQGFSVLLMKRPSRSSFMGGMHVFPGGKVEDEDFALAPCGIGHVLSGRMGLEAAHCEAYAVAACRETFEEMALRLEAASLVYFDHWITPEIEPKRFDTRFFAAAVAADATPKANAEATSWGFYSPADTFALIEAGEMAMAPPTLVTMLRLAQYRNLADALSGLGRREVGPLQPELAGGDPITLVLPGHPAHSQKQRVADNPLAMVMLGSGRWKIEWD